MKHPHPHMAGTWRGFSRTDRDRYNRNVRRARRDYKRRLGSHERWAMMAYAREIQDVVDATPAGGTAHLRGGVALVGKTIRVHCALDGHGTLFVPMPHFKGCMLDFVPERDGTIVTETLIRGEQ